MARYGTGYGYVPQQQARGQNPIPTVPGLQPQDLAGLYQQYLRMIQGQRPPADLRGIYARQLEQLQGLYGQQRALLDPTLGLDAQNRIDALNRPRPSEALYGYGYT